MKFSLILPIALLGFILLSGCTQSYCGNYVCDRNESPETCPSDCGDNGSVIGNAAYTILEDTLLIENGYKIDGLNPNGFDRREKEGNIFGTGPHERYILNLTDSRVFFYYFEQSGARSIVEMQDFLDGFGNGYIYELVTVDNGLVLKEINNELDNITLIISCNNNFVADTSLRSPSTTELNQMLNAFDDVLKNSDCAVEII